METVWEGRSCQVNASSAEKCAIDVRHEIDPDAVTRGGVPSSVCKSVCTSVCGQGHLVGLRLRDRPHAGPRSSHSATCPFAPSLPRGVVSPRREVVVIIHCGFCGGRC